MRKLVNSFLYCGLIADKAGNNLRTNTRSFTQNTQPTVFKNFTVRLYTYCEHKMHTVLHTYFLQFISVNGGYTHQSTGLTTITILYK